MSYKQFGWKGYTGIKHWKKWMEYPPQGNGPIVIRQTNQSHEDIITPDQLRDQYINLTNIWWRPWPEDGDL